MSLAAKLDGNSKYTVAGLEILAKPGVGGICAQRRAEPLLYNLRRIKHD